MIKTFRHKGLRLLYETGKWRGVQPNLADRIVRRVDAIAAATTIQDLALPGFDLHELKGKRKGTWSIKVSGNWRITFGFVNGEAFDLNLEDYH
jgi:proteic killer suppression protein